MHKLPQPVKLWYLSSFFRYEKPQAGRYRQFWQVGAEAIGSDDPSVDAEISAKVELLMRADKTARAYDPRTGRVVDCFTTEPGVQVYTSNGMNGSVVGSSGTTYRQTEGFTLETQHFPDSPNKPNFPTTELKPGQDFRSTTIFRFTTDTPLPPLPR